MGKSSYIFNFKKLPWAFLIALSVIIAIYCIELFVLPVNFFTFRCWEAAKVMKFLNCPFYPNMKLSMVESGDMGFHTRYAVGKKVDWETDRYGFRKHDTGLDKYRIVIVGDSAIMGTGLAQADMLSEVLGRRLKTSVYPFTFGGFLYTKRFIDNPPDTVIFESAEENIHSDIRGLFSPEQNGKKPAGWIACLLDDNFRCFLYSHQNLAVILDRIYKNAMFRYFVNRVWLNNLDRPARIFTGQKWMSSLAVQSPVDEKILFSRAAVDRIAYNNEVSTEEVKQIAREISAYAGMFKKRGIRFIFLPIPDKANIYYDYLPVKNAAKPKFLETLIRELQGRGIEVIDTQKGFDEAFHQKHIALYHTDDTHWNADGVRVTADLIEKILNN